MKQLIVGFLLFLVLGIAILFTADGGNGVSGSDAFKIATSHTGYWIWLLSSLVIAVIALYYAKVADLEAKPFKWIIACIAVFVTLCVFYFPVNIKTDPISSGITTEEINYLKVKGLK
jgi:cell division protein FtsW (lipid II flippase)